MQTQRVLVVEDDHGLRELLARGLRDHGFEVVTAVDGEGALRSAELEPHAVILDVGLPDSDGRDVCQALRSRGVDVPVIFLTARRDVHDRLAGFASGGDDYLAKPFSFPELLARLQALLRRHVRTPARFAELRVDPVAHCAVWGSGQIELSPIEFKLLARLLADDREIVRRRQLREVGWPHGGIVSDNTLDQYVSKLRRKLVDLGAPYAIRSARGVGYQVVALDHPV